MSGICAVRCVCGLCVNAHINTRCGHCKALKPEFEKAARALAADPGVVLAAMDATAHDIPAGFDVQVRTHALPTRGQPSCYLLHT